MAFVAHTTASGFTLPSIHSAPPFFTEQPNPATQSIATDQWSRLLLAYGRHRRLFSLRVEDADTAGSAWEEVLRNERINRKILPCHLSRLLAVMVTQNLAVYEPPKQTRTVLLYWRLPEEWADVLYDWATQTAQLNTILTFYDISDPAIPSALSGIPVLLLRKAITVLVRAGRAQTIGVANGEGVRIFASSR